MPTKTTGTKNPTRKEQATDRPGAAKKARARATLAKKFGGASDANADDADELRTTAALDDGDAAENEIDGAAESRDGERKLKRKMPEPMPESVKTVLKILADKKAIDPVVLDLDGLTDFTRYFVVVTGNSRPQVQALADAVIMAHKVKGGRGIPHEGDQDASWVLIDLGEAIVHVFQPAARRHYDLEGLWADAPRLPLPADL